MRYIKQQTLHERTIGDRQLIITADGNVEITPSSGEVIINGNLSVTGSSAGPTNDLIYYVSLEGNDTNNGLSSDAGGALRSIKKAVELAPEGATIQVAPGDYYEDNPISMKRRQTIRGTSLRNTAVWPNNNTQDFFLVDDACYLFQITFRGLRDPGWCVRIKPGSLVLTSPYVQNCSNINGPWLNDGTEFVPFETVQIEGVVPDALPIINNPDVPLAKRVNETGGGNGMLVDGNDYDPRSLIKSMVADAFTQVSQGGIGFHITNDGYTQIVSCFNVFTRIGFLTTNGGYLSISNSVSDFGTYGLYSDGYFNEPYTTSRPIQTYTSGVAAVTVTNGGQDYTSAPTVTIDPPTAPGGVQATATALVDLSNQIVVGVTITNPGSGYVEVPSVSITGGGASVNAIANVSLATNKTITVNSLRDLPQVGSVLVFDGDDTEYYITGSNVTQQPFRYDEEICRRDVRKILTYVAGDMAFDTNYQSIVSGRAYLRTTAQKVTLNQTQPTIYALEALRDEMLAYIPESDPANEDMRYNLIENFAIINNMIERGDSTAIPDVVYNDLTTIPSTTIAAKNNIVLNRDFIVQEVTRYISTQFNDLTYNSSTCLRDIEYIIKAVYRDIQLGTNHNSITAGLAYRRANASVVDEAQLAATILALRYAQDLSEALVVGNATALSRTTDRFEILLEAIEYGTLPSEGTTFPNPTGSSTALQDSARQLQDNRAFLVAETVAYIKDTYSSFVFDETLCARDTGYIIDAITHDLLYGGNIATLIAARAYFYNNITTVPGQVTETAEAIAHLASVAESVIEGILVSKSPSNIEDQVRDPGFGTATQSAIATGLFNIVETAIVDGLLSTPGESEPDTSWVNSNIVLAANILNSSISSIQTSVIDYIENTIKTFTYNVDTCERDIGYIIDAATYDMMYGGNKQTRLAAEAYYSNSVIVGEEGFTEFAIKKLGALLSDIAQNIIVEYDTSYPIVQQLGPSAGSLIAGNYIKLMVDKIAEVIKLGSTTYLPNEVDHSYSSLADADRNAARQLMLNNLTAIENETIRLLNLEYGGIAILDLYPGIVTVSQNTIGSLTTVSTISTSGHAFEYVGAGITYNALPFYGGSPISENEFVESNGGKVFAGGVVDQIGNFKVGSFFTVNALSGAITLDANQINLSGISSLGPLRRDGVLVGVELKEISNNRTLLSSLGTPDGNTVPTQEAIVGYLEDNYVSKTADSVITGSITLEADLTFGNADIITSAAVFNLADTTTSTVNAFGDATEVNIGSDTGVTNIWNDTNVYGDLTVAGADDSSGGSISTNSTEFDLVNTTATTVNFAGAATTIEIGAATGTTSVNNDLDVDGEATLASAVIEDLTDNRIVIAGTGGIVEDSEDLTFDGTELNIGIGNFTVEVATGNVYSAGTLEVGNQVTVASLNVQDLTSGRVVLAGTSGELEDSLNLTFDGSTLAVTGTITASVEAALASARVSDLTSGRVVLAGTSGELEDSTNLTFDGTTLTVTGAVSVDNITIDGNSILSNDADGPIYISPQGNGEVIADTLTVTDLTDNRIVIAGTSGSLEDDANFTFDGTTFNVGSTGEFSVDVSTGDTEIKGDLAVNGGDLTTTATSFNLLDTDVTTISAFGAATAIDIGAGTGTTTINHDLAVEGGDITTTATTFNLLNANATTINIGSDATAVSIGNSTGTTTINHDLAVEGGDITTTALTFNLLDTDATTVNFAGAATTIDIGAGTGTTTVNHNLDVGLDINVDGGDITTTATTFNLLDTNATTVNFAGAATTLDIAATSGTTSINNNLDVGIDVRIIGSNLTTDAVTFNLLNTNATTVNAFGAATAIDIGAATGTTSVNNDLDVDGNVNVDGGDITTNAATFNLLDTNATTVNAFGAATAIDIGAGTGTTTINHDLAVEGGDLTTTQTTFNLIDTNATTVNFAGDATAIDIGAATGNTTVKNNLVVDLDAAINGGDLTTTATTFNLLNANVTTVNAFGAATDVQIGASTGTTNINNDLDVDGDVNVDGGDLTTNATTFNLINANATTVNFAGAATTINVGDSSSTVTLNGDLAVEGGDLTTTATTFNLVNANATTVNFAGAATALDIGASTGTTSINNDLDVDGDVNVDGGDLTTNQTTFNLLDTNATTVNFAGAATAIDIGAATGITSINNHLDVDLDLNVDGGVISTNALAFNIINANATTVNAFGAATSITIGQTTGTTNFRNNVDVDLDLNVDGGDITTNAETFNLLNANATTVNAFGAATTIDIGATSGTTSINNNLDVDLDLNVDGGDITTTQTSFNLINTNATTLNIGGAATTLELGAASGTTSVNNNLDVDLDLNVDGGDLTTNATTFNLLNANATTVNFAGDATAISIGNSTGTTTVNHDLAVNGGDLTTTATTFNLLNANATTVNFASDATAISIGNSTGTTTVNHDLAVEGGDLTTTATTFNLLNANATTLNIGGDATAIDIGAATGTTSINNDLDVDGDVNVDGGDITTTQTTFNLLNANATTVNAFGDATAIDIGASTGTTSINNNLDVDGDVNVDGGDITTTQTTFNLLNANATTLNIGGDATTLELGAATGTTSINNDLDVDGDVNVDGGDLTTNQTTFNLLDANATTINFGGDATSIDIGAATGITSVNNNLDVDGDVNVDGGNITTNATTFSLVNANATTVNLAGAATNIQIGSNANVGGVYDGTTNINQNLVVDGDTTLAKDLAVNGGDLTTTQTTFNLVNENATTVNFAGEVETLNIGIDAANASTITVGPEITGNILAINSTTSGTVTLTSDVTTGTVNLFANVTTGTVNIATADASTINIGGTGSVTNISELTLETDLEVQYGGTGAGTFTTDGILYGNGTDPLQVTDAAGTSDTSNSFQILTVVGGGDNTPVWTDTIDGGTF